MTSFVAFRPSTRTFCHTPFWTNANTFYVLNSTSTVLLMEFIVCILLDKTYCIAFYKVLLSTESCNDVGYSCTFQLSFLFFFFGDACMYLCTFYPPSFCQAVQYSTLKFLLAVYNLPCSCKCPSLPHMHAHACLGMLQDDIGLKPGTSTKIRT